MPHDQVTDPPCVRPCQTCGILTYATRPSHTLMCKAVWSILT
ncbi:DNA-directed RNA polymerase II subunit RPB2 [Gossypium arboreum]|uniref:DNA-directed RNA polymerase II subunit RPB2 n=1 Tax=Gossypium arboreum TaxID=29729 RepID=A0A0B0N4C3_GOSAR|nr:DNA-directed RNA polymerase II subunit RPB2 [Gossypium arboreum]